MRYVGDQLATGMFETHAKVDVPPLYAKAVPSFTARCALSTAHQTKFSKCMVIAKEWAGLSSGGFEPKLEDRWEVEQEEEHFPIEAGKRKRGEVREVGREDEWAAREGGIAMDMPSEEPPPASGRHGVADFGNEVLSGWEED